MSKYGEAISIHQFCKAHAQDYDHTGIYHIGGGRWVGRCASGVLLTHNGLPYLTLEEALADLASVGIRRIAIEWDGLPASDRSKVELKAQCAND